MLQTRMDAPSLYCAEFQVGYFQFRCHVLGRNLTCSGGRAESIAAVGLRSVLAAMS